jgi:KH domain-containing protein
MQEIYMDNIGKVISSLKKLESGLKVKIKNKGKNVFISGKPEDEFVALKVMEAINLGFSVERALFLKNPEFLLQIVNIKDVTKKHNLEEIRARIIGTEGGTLKNINTLTDCAISLKDNQIGIIGDCEDIAEAVQAVTSLVRGSKQSHVYARLEREKKKKRLMGKGIKEI